MVQLSRHFQDWLYQRLGMQERADYFGRQAIGPGRRKKLGKEMDEALASISAAAKGFFDPYRPWTDPQARILDRQNVYNFVMKCDWSDLCKMAVLQQQLGAQALTSTRGCATAARRGSRPDRTRPIIATLAIWSKRG
jgi:hypothetical protein